MSYIYFLKRQLGGLIKIGYSKNPASRVANHRMVFGRMGLLGVLPGGIREEQEIHSRFSHLQLVGHRSSKRQHMQEFFLPGPELLSFVAERCKWVAVCGEMEHELTKRPRFSRSRIRAKSILAAIEDGFDLHDIADAYDVPISSVRFVENNRNGINFCKV